MNTRCVRWRANSCTVTAMVCGWLSLAHVVAIGMAPMRIEPTHAPAGNVLTMRKEVCRLRRQHQINMCNLHRLAARPAEAAGLRGDAGA